MDQNQSVVAGPKCPCPHHKMVPIWLIVLGLVLLLGNLGVLSGHLTDILWPIIIIVIGLQKLFEQRCKCCSRM